MTLCYSLVVHTIHVYFLSLLFDERTRAANFMIIEIEKEKK